MKHALVVDYGVVNLKNILRGLEHVGAQVEVSSDPDQVFKAGRVILPGVGAFESGMNELESTGIDEAIKSAAKAGQPILGICLGMQMLLDTSNEYGQHKGLGLIPGSVVAIPNENNGRRVRKIPHIGWNAIQLSTGVNDWQDSCLDCTPVGTYCYFVHSFMAVVENSSHLLAECMYEGIEVAGAIKKENVTGLQFHPERSGPAGLEILRRFVSS